MKSFSGILDTGQMAAVAAFVEHEFVRRKAANTAYHTATNGWPGHERYAVAYPFATGTLALDTPVDQLDDGQRRGRTLFLEACISCHDRGRVTDDDQREVRGRCRTRAWDSSRATTARPRSTRSRAPASMRSTTSCR